MSAEEVLELLAQSAEEEYKAAEIANELNISKKAVGVYLANLSDEGLVEHGPGDELRSARWSVREAGRAAASDNHADR